MQRPPIYTNPIGLSSLFPICGLPIRLDSYKGCVFNCAYCFARARERSIHDTKVKPADPNYLNKLFKRSIDENKESFVGQFIQRRVPIHFGGMSDPFQPAETKYKTSLAYLRTFARYSYPVVISTRGVMVAEEPYLILLKQMKSVIIQFSLSSIDDQRSSVVEEERVSPSNILRAMEKLAKHGVSVTSRWQPYIPTLGESIPDFISTVSSAGCSHLSFEHLKILIGRRQRVVQSVHDYNGIDILDYYKKEGAYYLGREFILPAETRLKRVLEVRDITHKAGMTLGVADNDLQHYSDTDCCCSGADKFEGFDNWFKYQASYAIRKSRGKEISLEAIKDEWAPTGSIDRYLNSMSRLSTRGESEGTLKQHLQYRWNNPGSEGCPSFYYGIEPAGRYSSDGNIIFSQ